MGRSVAFKCTYNDGGEGIFVGFADTCSRDNIERNVKNGRVWCSSPLCLCRKFYDEGMRGNKPVAPCYESELFQKWEFGAGGFHTGIKAGQRIPLTQTEAGDFAILTTRFPGEAESERHIIGLFRIGKVENRNRLIAAPPGRIRLPLEEAKRLYFWAYCSNSANNPDWRTGLFRYLESGQVHRILEDIVATVQDENTRLEIIQIIDEVFGGRPAPPASGCLSGRSTERRTAIALARKYGAGGEGRAHRELKEWLSKHPETIGVTDASSVAVEYNFISGDSADLVFTHKSGAYTVVEVETAMPMPGAYQAIKYRALLCAEKGLPLDTDRVKAVLIAWSVPPDVQSLCEKYGIRYQEHNLCSVTH